MSTHRWNRPLLGAALGAALAVLGPVGTAVGWLGEAVGLYSRPIPYSASVGVLAYAEGRVEAQAHWTRTREVEVCDDFGCETGEAYEALDITVAEGAGAGGDQHVSAHGQVNPAVTPRGDHEARNWAGRTVFFSARYEYCGPDACFDRYIDLSSSELRAFDFQVDPLLQSATFHAELTVWDEDGDSELSVDVAWESDSPLGPGGSTEAGHQVDPAPGAGFRVAHESTVGRTATATWDLDGFAPASDGSGDQFGGSIRYAAIPGHARGEAHVPVRAPCLDAAPPETCEL